ncbi:MAG: patatin-like phospholipase family protein [Capsulimonadaceae bacterium]|nr:patatin-like phospholipase family protein [Capsulimonadaceae bacterium]
MQITVKFRRILRFLADNSMDMFTSQFRPERTHSLRSPRRFATLATALLALTFFAFSALCWADPGSVPQGRPKIGLALAGGSALGFCHVGVLQWLHDHRIPIDYIAGTSMGGLIAGAYAAGMPAEEIRGTLAGVDWSQELSATPPYALRTYRRREDLHDYPNGWEFGWRGGPVLPSGMNPGQPIGLLLSRICIPYPSLERFDDLPTPFRCVATDMATGEAATLDSGSLETALRATMAIQGYFTPVTRNGRVLSDGGLVDNLPADVVRRMGADIVIAVDLTPQLQDKEALQSMVNLLGQSATIAVLNNERQSLLQADIVISPSLKALSSFDFSKMPEFYKRGYDAAQEKQAILARLAVSDDEWRAYLSKRASRRPDAALTPQFVDVAGVSGSEAAALRRNLASLAGKPLDTAQLERRLTTITGEGRYLSASYERAEENGQQGLLVRVLPRPYTSAIVNVAPKIDGSESNHILTTLGTRVTNMGAGGDETRTDVEVGSRTGVSSEYYRPMAGTRLFIAPSVTAHGDDQNLYAGTNHLVSAKKYTDGVGVDAGYTPSLKSQLRLGASVTHLDESVTSGETTIGNYRGDVVAYRARYDYDGLDDLIGANRGARITASATDYASAPGASKAFTEAEMRAVRIVPVGPRYGLFGFGSCGTSFGSQVPLPEKFTLGGPMRLGAYGQNRYQGNEYVVGTAGVLYRLMEVPPPLNSRVLLGLWYERGGIFDRGAEGIQKSDIGIGTLLTSPVGPILASYAFGEDGNHGLSIAIGTLF